MSSISFDAPMTPADHICSRLYYVVSTGSDLVQSVSKAAFAIFATIVAGTFLGRSEFLNEWCQYAWKDALFSGMMLLQSLRGIIDPLGAYLAKMQMHKDNCIGSFFDQKTLTSLSEAECVAGSFLFAGKGFAEIANISMSACRVISSLILYAGSCGHAPTMAVLGWGSCLSLVRSIAVTGACFYSATVPREAYLPLNVENSAF